MATLASSPLTLFILAGIKAAHMFLCRSYFSNSLSLTNRLTRHCDYFLPFSRLFYNTIIKNCCFGRFENVSVWRKDKC